MTRCDPPPRCSLTTPPAPSPCRPPCCTRSAHRTSPSAITPPMPPGSTRGSSSDSERIAHQVPPDLASSPQPTNQGAEKRSKCEGVEGAAATAAAATAAATAYVTAARDDEVNSRAARHPG